MTLRPFTRNETMTIRLITALLAGAFMSLLFISVPAGQAAPTTDGEKIQVGTGRIAVSFKGNRQFFLSEETVITERGTFVPPETLIQVGTGRVARFSLASGVNDGITEGTLTTIEFGAQIKGPVTRVSPLTVLSLPVLATADTVLRNLADVGQIQVGDELELGGFADADGNFQATLIERKDDPLAEWVISGPVTQIDGSSSFAIGAQTIAFNGLQPSDCDGALTVGTRVEVDAAPQVGFAFGSTLTTTSDIECEPDGLTGEPGALVPALVEGFISAVNGDEFTVAGQRVMLTPSTEFDDGDPEDVQIGVAVQVEGLLDTNSGVLEAVEVEFDQLRFEAEGPVAPEDISGDEVRLFGVTLRATPLTDDDDNLLGGIPGDRQIRVKGFLDAEDTVFIDEIEDRGTPDPNDVSLRGPVDGVARPTFTIRGVTVDTTGSIFQRDDDSGANIDADTFFSLVRIGSEVEIEDAVLNGATNTLSGGIVAIETPDDKRYASGRAKGDNPFGVGLGVIVESGDLLFQEGFE